MTKHRTTLRAAVPVAALALVLTACGPENDDPAVVAAPTAAGTTAGAPAGAPTGAPTTAPTGAPAATGGGAAGGGGTATANPAPSAATSGNPVGGASGGGSKITFENPLPLTATGSYLGKTKADVTPVSVVKGTTADLAPFNFKPADVAGKTPYYVTVSFTNRTGAPLNDEYFMMRFKVNTDAKATGILAAPTILKSIPACDSGKKPGTLADGQSQQQCAVYLVPNDTPPQFLTFGSVLDTQPLIWKAS
ncbi:hypothetical protein PUR61_17270 [Streptomyces sp. BE20]|uniref:hypothetical protein n=1 Tax=Streptomyces sp. BE20 TaxID=3002525 RepID=UPI002E78414B|nr:hypothetical protein [Streptomyces sp. BE20]MEE1823929.1 hypothetical protein [Streptomyces sp. BE20]